MQSDPPQPNIDIADRTIAGPHGDIPIRIYRPEAPTHGLVWVHGGGFAMGNIDEPESDWVSRELASRRITVVTVDYRLAPVPEWMAQTFGTPAREGFVYPVASEEVSSVFTWVTSQPNMDPLPWSLGGASAGANLAAGAALRLRDESARPAQSLLLTYGLFHRELPSLSAELQAKCDAHPAAQEIFTEQSVDLINANYAGDDARFATSYAFPGGHDLHGLPPTLLLNSDVDSLRASGEQFGVELVSAGVDTLVIREPGSVHGHLSTPDKAEAARSIDRMFTWLTSDLVAGPESHTSSSAKPF